MSYSSPAVKAVADAIRSESNRIRGEELLGAKVGFYEREERVAAAAIEAMQRILPDAPVAPKDGTAEQSARPRAEPLPLLTDTPCQSEGGFYRKLPVVIEAHQLEGPDFWYRAPEWLLEVERVYVSAQPGEVRRVGDGLDIVTLEGVMHADRGDWIIRGVKGEIYPCKPDIFALTYEPALDPDRQQ